ncbi:MAG: hypothetical protein L3V56_08980 [Candidatus Magnetoovum sp. WYHC-5]|nr:hypothetical protein [Candidatus Magnetoovum sp. WYHC-5]
MSEEFPLDIYGRLSEAATRLQGRTRQIIDNTLMLSNEVKECRLQKERHKAIFKAIPVPALVWRVINGEFILIDYNDEMYRISEAKVIKHIGMAAKAIYVQTPDIVSDMERCLMERTMVQEAMSYCCPFSLKHSKIKVSCNYAISDIVITVFSNINEDTNEIVEQAIEQVAE